MLYERRHTRAIAEYGGLAKQVTPVIAAVFVVVTLSSIGLPGTNGFVGEFLILSGTWLSRMHAAGPLAALAAVGVILGAVYMLLLVQRVFFGRIKKEENRSLSDLSVREGFVLAPHDRAHRGHGAPASAVPPAGEVVGGPAACSASQAAEAKLGGDQQVGTVPTAVSRAGAHAPGPRRGESDMTGFPTTSFVALVPVAILTLGAIVLLLTRGVPRLRPARATSRSLTVVFAGPDGHRGAGRCPGPARCSAGRPPPTGSRCS